MARDVYQLIALGQTGSEFWEFVQHFESGVTSSTDPATDAEFCISSFMDNLQDPFLTCLPSQCSISGYKCKRVNNSGGPSVMHPITPQLGTRSGNLAVGSVGPCIVSMYNNGARWTAGRLFMPGVIQGDIASNHFSSGLITAAQNFILALVQQYTAGTTWDFVIWSKKLTLPFSPFSIDLSLKAGIQKRRLLPVI